MQDLARRKAITLLNDDLEPAASPVSQGAFTYAMTNQWLALGNTPSAPLQHIWGTMAAAFNDAIMLRDPVWRVLQPPTGTGKTQGLCVYSALTIDKNRVSPGQIGILVVTPTIQQADEIVNTIRSLLPIEDVGRVQTSHSENNVSGFAIESADVLVLTHAAYTRGLERRLAEDHKHWDNCAKWAHGPRRLTIIDEALAGLVEENQVKAQHIGLVLTCMDGELRRQFPTEFRALRTLWDALHCLDMHAAGAQANNEDAIPQAVIWTAADDGRLPFPRICPMASLREAMSPIPYDQILLRKHSSDDRDRIYMQVDETLRNCEAMIKRWCYSHQKGRDATLNSSQLLIPSDLPGPVVLDATATQNFFWTLLGDRALRVPIPQGVRSYSNVSLHIARSSCGLGKGKMRDSGKVRIPRLLADLERQLSPDRKVMLRVHKNVEPIALTCQPNFAYSVVHWGAIGGKNDWADHDTAVVLGMSYRDPASLTNMFFALQGLQDDEWLGERSWGPYEDVHEEMQRGQLAASIIQAINRVCCRRVIDAEGNCPPAHIFIVLRAGEEGDVILGHIREEMPGLVVKPWLFELDGPQERIRRGSSHAAVLAFVRNHPPGKIRMSDIKKETWHTPIYL